MAYANTNEKLYDDIALWEKTDGKDLFLQMPLKEKQSPKILDFGYGFGEQLFALANAYPNGTIFGIDGSPYCQKEVAEKIAQRKITNITLINKMVNDLSDFADDSLDLVLLYDALHATSNKYMLYEESHRILKAGGVLSILPVHLSNWRDRQGKKKTYTPKLIQSEIEEYGFSYAGTCTQKGVHWEKCHTLYYIKKGNITFDILEKVDVMNFVKSRSTDMNQEQNQDQENIQLLSAKPQDVMMLTAFSKWAFETDVQVGAPVLAGPPGYKSNQFYSQMNRAKYLYSFFANGIIIGGAVLIPGGNPKGSQVEIARIFLNPEHFKKGYGLKLMQAAEALFPDAKSFILDTPIWNIRTNSFYKKLGYIEYKRNEEFVFYRKDKEE